MKAFKKSGYSTETAINYIDSNAPISSLSVKLEKQYKYEDGKRTDEITGYKAWFTQAGAPAFTVKFAHEIELPKYMSLVQFDNLQAIEIRYNVYFKADGIVEVK